MQEVLSTRSSKNGGLTLIETVVGMAVFVVIATVIYLAYANLLSIFASAQFHNTALAILNGEIEDIRNIPYQELGTIGGIPSGAVPQSKIITVDNLKLTLNTTIRNIDDPFDGTIGGTPNDTSPADYKLVEISITCQECPPFYPTTMTTTVAPLGLESSSTNGSLFIRVIDASGNPVVGADVTVVNNAISPAINLQDSTNVNGQLQLIDVPPSNLSYEVTVSKSGYSSERTYAPGEPSNPNPVNPHASVVAQNVTQLTLAIDRLSSLTFSTRDNYCQPVAGVDFSVSGTKLIGTDPDVPKFYLGTVTDPSGQYNNSSLEWDFYAFSNLDADYFISGTSSPSSFVILPDSAMGLLWNMRAANPNTLLVKVTDINETEIKRAKVELSQGGLGGAIIASGYTGVADRTETDWSGGQYATITAGMTADAVPGDLLLVQDGFGGYPTVSMEELVSKTIDLGTASVSYDKIEANWSFGGAGVEGHVEYGIQIAVNNDNATWSFAGPDGTPSTYYKGLGTEGEMLSQGLKNNRYLRYRVVMRALDQVNDTTPVLHDIDIMFSSACFPAGQVLLNSFSDGTYGLTVEKSGFATYSEDGIILSNDWQEKEIELTVP